MHETVFMKQYCVYRAKERKKIDWIDLVMYDWLAGDPDLYSSNVSYHGERVVDRVRA